MEPIPLSRQLTFLMELDKMKSIYRRTLLIDGSRRETDAEHSWHMAVAAMVLFDESPLPGRNLLRVIQMALVHDLVEIFAGDTFAYDTIGYADKQQRESEAADKLFALLPEPLGQVYRSLWEEFDAMETPDARYAAAIDRLQPFLNNYGTQGHTWLEGNVRREQVYERMAPVKDVLPVLWPFVTQVVEQAVQSGYLQP